MSRASIEAGQRWLVAGGFAEPCTYGQLVQEVIRDNAELSGHTTPGGVGELLIAMLRAAWRGQTIKVGEPEFEGEGVSRLGPQAMDPARGLLGDKDAFFAQLMGTDKGRVVLSSSGSEGAPSAVTHKMRTLGRAVVTGDRHRNDVWGLAFNPAHIAAEQVLLQAIANGNTIVNLWGIPSGEVIQRCRYWGVTHLSATPTFYRMIAAQSLALPAIRSISVGGEASDEQLMHHLRRMFPAARLHNVYASTEAGTVLASDGVDFQLRDIDSTRLRINQGRLWIHRDMFADSTCATEWFDTGDLVEITGVDPTRFRIVGRRGNILNVGGEKVNPLEVEAALAEHPAVAVSRVFGRRNSVTGAILAADIVSKGDRPEEADLRDHLVQRLPAYKIPRIIRFVDRLELTGPGKVKRI